LKVQVATSPPPSNDGFLKTNELLKQFPASLPYRFRQLVMGTFKYHMTLHERERERRRRGGWLNRHLNFIVAEKA